MEAMRLSRLVAEARDGNRQAREELLAFHRPFVMKIASRLSGRPLHWENDDELSVALLAFNEALDRYEGRQGATFLTYATTVIRYRLIDHFRRQARSVQTIPLAAALEDDLPTAPAEVQEAWARFEAHQEEIRTAEEIDLFTAQLGQYGITLADLVSSSPRHRDTKSTLLRVVRLLLSDPELLAYLHRRRQLPIQELEALAGVSRKVLESGRRYIHRRRGGHAASGAAAHPCPYPAARSKGGGIQPCLNCTCWCCR